MTNNDDGRAPVGRPHLLRSRQDRVLGGVCAGVARHLGIDTTLVRIVAVLLGLVSGGSAVLVYLLAWALVPDAVHEPRRTQFPPAAGGAREAWNTAGGDLRFLAAGLRSARPPSGAGPDAVAGTRARSPVAMVDEKMTALGDRLRDREVQEGARRATAGVSAAFVASANELGSRARRYGTSKTGDAGAPAAPGPDGNAS